MPRIEREGTYRGRVIEHGMGETTNGYPQWIARLAADQMFVQPDDREAFAEEGYDISEDGWIDCSDWGWTITGYFCMFNNEKALLSYDQVIEATGWDGSDFAGLQAMDLTEHSVQYRTGLEEYNGNESMKVKWLDAVGAPVNRELASIDEKDAKALTNKFKSMMRGKPKAAPAAAPASKPKATPAAKPKAGAAKPAASKATKAPAAPPKPKKSAAEQPAGMTKEQAWEHLLETSGLDDDGLADAWIAACEQVAPDKDEDDFTTEDWGSVAATVLAGVS